MNLRDFTFLSKIYLLGQAMLKSIAKGEVDLADEALRRISLTRRFGWSY